MNEPNEIANSNQQDINISKLLGTRIKKIIQGYTNGNQSAFAKLTGIKAPSVIDYLEARRVPSVNVIAKIKIAIPDIDLNWLLNPSETYRNIDLGDKIWLVNESDSTYRQSTEILEKELAQEKEHNTTLKEFNDMLKGQVEFLKAELAKAQQQ
jgi:hypothetical protein